MQGEEGSYIRVVETVRSRAHKSQRGGRELFGIFDDPGKEKEREREREILRCFCVFFCFAWREEREIQHNGVALGVVDLSSGWRWWFLEKFAPPL